MQWYKYVMPIKEYLAGNEDVIIKRLKTAVENFNNNELANVLMCCQLDPERNMIFYISQKGFDLLEQLLGERNYKFFSCEQPTSKKIKYHWLLSASGWGDKKLWNKILRDSGMLDEQT